MRSHSCSSHSRGHKRTGWLALAALLGTSAASMAASDAFTGSFSENFDSMGTTGTTAPAGWSVYSIAGSHDTFSPYAKTGTPGGAPTSTAIASATLGSATFTAGAATTQKGIGGFNFATTASDTNRALGTSPSGNAMTLLQLSLTNTTGGAINDLFFGYDMRRFTTTVDANSYTASPFVNVEEYPGYQLWYSLDNGSTWTNVSKLNPSLDGSTGPAVPNSVGVTTVAPTDVMLSSLWAAGSTLLVRWADDNAQSPSPDQLLGLDNVTITAVPEPASVLAGLGLVGFLALRHFRRRSSLVESAI